MKYFGNTKNIRVHRFQQKNKNNKLSNNINDALIDLRNAIIIGSIPGIENPNKIVDIVKTILDFYTQQRGKGFLWSFTVNNSNY